MAVRGDIRNVAIVAHVDHGKTTLVNAMLAQSHVFNEREEVPDRVMDSNDLEREKGITILAKNTAVQYTGPLAAKYGHPEGITLNIIDTPGHADFGGEVERGISMVDGVVLLVDASEGPLPQTRFVLRKALEAKLPVILCVNKTDRPDARISEVVGESSDLLLGLAQDVIEEGIDLDEDSLFDLPVIYCAAKAGYASENQPENGGLPDNDNLEPLFEAIIKNIPAPEYEEGAPLQAHVANIDSSDFLGRLGLVRIYNGTLEKGKTYGLSRVDGSIENFRVVELLRTQGLERTPVESAGPGDIVAVAGVNDIMIGETIVDPNDPKPLPLIHVDDPAISMTFGTNDSPLAGREGKDHKLTARMLKDRLDRELIGNVSIKVLPTDRPDAWEVQGRGELALAILAEQMRRAGFELTVGRPQVVTKTIDGVVNEPMENTTIDVPEEYMGAVTQLLADRKGRMDNMTNHGTGWVRLQFTVPSRGLIGFRTALLSATRGTGIASSLSAGYAPWAGAIVTRQNGSMVSDRAGVATPYAMQRLQARGNFFVEPQSNVYEGQVVGINNKPDELDVNITLAKHMTNMRSSTADVLETLTPPIKMSLEESLDFANEDECVEVTPEAIRVRKIILSREDWYKWRAKQRRGDKKTRRGVGGVAPPGGGGWGPPPPQHPPPPGGGGGAHSHPGGGVPGSPPKPPRGFNLAHGPRRDGPQGHDLLHVLGAQHPAQAQARACQEDAHRAHVRHDDAARHAQARPLAHEHGRHRREDDPLDHEIQERGITRIVDEAGDRSRRAPGRMPDVDGHHGHPSGGAHRRGGARRCLNVPRLRRDQRHEPVRLTGRGEAG